MLLHVRDSLVDLETEIVKFVGWYNINRYHDGFDNVTPDDIYLGRRKMIHQKRTELKVKTILEREEYNSKILETGVEIVSS